MIYESLIISVLDVAFDDHHRRPIASCHRHLQKNPRFVEESTAEQRTSRSLITTSPMMKSTTLKDSDRLQSPMPGAKWLTPLWPRRFPPPPPPPPPRPDQFPPPVLPICCCCPPPIWCWPGMKGSASLLIIDAEGDIGPLLLVLELGINGVTFGNICEINFAKGLTGDTVATGTPAAGGSVPGFGEMTVLDASLTDMVGVDGDI